MIDIDKQILTIIVSFIFGIVFSIQVSLNYKYIYTKNYLYKIIFTLAFIMTNTFLYFIILRKTNNGILHIYGILSILFGYFAEMFIKSIIVKKIKK